MLESHFKGSKFLQSPYSCTHQHICIRLSQKTYFQPSRKKDCFCFCPLVNIVSLNARFWILDNRAAMSTVITSTLGECFVYKMQMLIMLPDLLEVQTYFVL